MQYNQAQNYLMGRLINELGDLGQRDVPPVGTTNIAVFPTNDLKKIYVKLWDTTCGLHTFEFDFTGEVTNNQPQFQNQLPFQGQQQTQSNQPFQNAQNNEIMNLLQNIASRMDSLEEKVNNQNKKKNYYPPQDKKGDEQK